MTNPLEMMPDIEINTLFKLDAIGFRKRTKTITSGGMMDFYLQERYNRYGEEGILPVEYTFQYQEICKDRTRRVLSVAIEDDTVVCVFKWVLLFQHNYLRIEGLPISLNGITKNEDMVFSVLKDVGLIKKVGLCEGEIAKSECSDLDMVMDSYNYVANVESKMNRLRTSKWRSKNGVNKVLGVDGFEFTEVKKDHKESIGLLCDSWTDWRNENVGAYEGDSKLRSAIDKIIGKKIANCKLYYLNYKDTPLAFIVYVRWFNVAHQIINKTVSKTFIEGDDNFSFIKKHIGPISYYLTMCELSKLGCELVYFSGVFPTMKGYKKSHKVKNSERNISQYIYMV